MILLVSLLNIQCSDLECSQDNPPNKNTCNAKTVANSDQYCCYYKAKIDGLVSVTCHEISGTVYNNIGVFIDEIENSGATVESFDCKSSFIEFGLFSLIFLLL